MLVNTEEWYRQRQKGDWAKSRREKGDYDLGDGRSGEGRINKIKIEIRNFRNREISVLQKTDPYNLH